MSGIRKLKRMKLWTGSRVKNRIRKIGEVAGETDEFRSLNRTVPDLSREALRILSN